MPYDDGKKFSGPNPRKEISYPDSSAPSYLFHEHFGEDSLTLKTGGGQEVRGTSGQEATRALFWQAHSAWGGTGSLIMI